MELWSDEVVDVCGYGVAEWWNCVIMELWSCEVVELWICGFVDL